MKEKEVFSYAYEIVISDVFYVLLSLAIGILFGKVIEMLIFLICYGTLRTHAGGYHASTRIRCSMISFCVIVLVMCFNYIRYDLFPEWIFYIMLIINSLGIAILSPVEAVNKPLDMDERKKNKRATLVVVLLFDVFSCLALMILQSGVLIYNVVLVYIAVFLLQLLGIVKQNQYKKDHGR